MIEERKREKKRSKTKKDGKSGTAEKCTEPIPKTELTEGSPLAQRVEEPPSSDAPARVKTSKKRKRSERDALAVLDGSETNTTELKPRKHKKRNKTREKDQMCHPSYPDPADDESLPEQSRKALSYIYERWRGIEGWKFNKARQNWLLRNIWSEEAIPESYVGLVIEYLAGIRGGAREKLVEECISKMSISEEAPIQSAKPSEDSSEDRSKIIDGSMINEQSSTSRAQSLLHTLKTAETMALSNCIP